MYINEQITLTNTASPQNATTYVPDCGAQTQ